VIDFALSHTLCLFHPFASPFITEELGTGWVTAATSRRTRRRHHHVRALPKRSTTISKRHYRVNEATSVCGCELELVHPRPQSPREFNIAANKKVKFILKVKDRCRRKRDVSSCCSRRSLDVDPNFRRPKGNRRAD